MKITFLVTRTDDAVRTRARQPAPAHDVEVLSLFGPRTSTRTGTGQQPEPFAVRHLVDGTGAHPRPVRPCALGAEECRRLGARRSALVDPELEPDVSALSDVELELALRTLDADVLVTASPALVPAVCDLVPARVVTVHQEHRPDGDRDGNRGSDRDTGGPLLSRAPELDALVVPTERARAWFRQSLGEAAPRLATSAQGWEALLAELCAERRGPARLRARADRAAAHRAAAAAADPAAVPVSVPAGGRAAVPSAGEQRAREEELRAASGRRLVRSAGQLAQVRDDLPAAGAYDENLRLVAAALQRAELPYVLLRDRNGGARHRLAVDAARQPDVCRALAEAYGGQAVYAELRSPSRAAADAPGTVLAESLAGVAEVRRLRVYRPYVTSGRTLRYGPGYGCDVEFWRYDAAAAGPAGAYAAPARPSALGPLLPSLTPDAVLRVGGRDYPTLAEFNERLATDIGFPVDAVCTRFRDRGGLRYTLRSLAMFAPWIRTVHVVTDDPVPSWLAADHPGLHVVPHRARPHRIDGLAEHFLHLDDDVFLGRTLPASRFFRSNGTTRHGALRVAYVDMGRHQEHARLTRLLANRTTDAFRLGEGPAADVPPHEQAEVRRAFLESYLPVPGPYEKEKKQKKEKRAEPGS